MMNGIMPGVSPFQMTQANGYQPMQGTSQQAASQTNTSQMNMLQEPTMMEKALNALNSIAQARATTSAGLTAAQDVSDLYSGLKGAMLTQGSADGSTNDLISGYLEQLNSVIDTSRIDNISMVQQGNTLVVVITMEEGYWEEQGIDSASLDQDVSNLADIDASTPEGFADALDAVESGLQNALKAIEMLQEILEKLQESEDSSLLDLVSDQVESLSDVTDVIEALGSDTE